MNESPHPLSSEELEAIRERCNSNQHQRRGISDFAHNGILSKDNNRLLAEVERLNAEIERLRAGKK